jgi:hypothetical protein
VYVAGQTEFTPESLSPFEHFVTLIAMCRQYYDRLATQVCAHPALLVDVFDIEMGERRTNIDLVINIAAGLNTGGRKQHRKKGCQKNPVDDSEHKTSMFVTVAPVMRRFRNEKGAEIPQFI